ncbi:MAG: AAA domain-containing protein [Deltaproteobacteria bacterium]|nr:AAA domain-containing protein [Deltaproteobacteria bacterium]
MDRGDPKFEVVRERVGRVFEFLRAVADTREAPARQFDSEWQLPLASLPKHPAVQLRGSGRDDDELLILDRVAEAPCPAPPDVLRDWLVPGWNRIEGPFETLHARNLMASDDESVVERFEDEPEREVRLTVYRRARDEWLAAEHRVQDVRAVYQRLFHLRSTLERDPDRYRLVIVDGFLSWKTAGGDVDVPLLVQDVELVFQAEHPRLVVRDGEGAPRFGDALVSLLPGAGPKLQELQAIVEESGDVHPLDDAQTRAFLGAAAARLWPDGRMVNERPATATTTACLYRRPTLALLKRTAGLPVALSAYQVALNAAERIPDPLARVVDPDSIKAKAPSSSAVDLLFTKPSNAAQERIATLLAEHGAVVVQGPPGTGKTHTIANLIGHLLAQGKSILVTSHTTKALRVLRDQVVPELRPLCVSVLDSDQESKKQLESSIHGIVDRLGKGDAGLEATAKKLQEQRTTLKAELQRKRAELEQGRRAEYDDVVVDGHAVSPSAAARETALGKGVNDWLPGPLVRGAPCPLSDAEVRELYRLNAELDDDDVAAAQVSLPEPAQLFSVERWAELVAALLTATPAQVSGWRSEPKDLRSVQAAIDGVTALLASRRSEAWWLAAVDAGLRGSLTPWTLLRERIVSAGEEAKKGAHLFDHKIDLGAWSLVDALRVCEAMSAHVAKGGALSGWSLLWNKDWKRFVDDVAVDGAPPRSTAALALCLGFVRLASARETLRTTWTRVMTAAGGADVSTLGAEPEQAAGRQLRFLDTAEAWRSELETVKAAVVDVGIDWDRLPLSLPPVPGRSALDDLVALLSERALPLLEDAKVGLKWRAAMDEVRAATVRLHPFRAVPCIAALLQALDARDVEAWRSARDKLSTLLARGPLVARRAALLKQLSPIAGTWSDDVARRMSGHRGPEAPGDPARAWRHRQWEQELALRQAIHLDAVQERIEQLEQEQRRVTREYVEALTWARQIRRTTPAQQNALLGWANSIKRYGKGTGKRAATLQKEMRASLELSRQAVPVWIMPLSRLLQSFTPGAARFDVVIVDEASQADMSALVALTMADTAVIVGDHEQVSPLGVGEDVGRYDPLIQQHLAGVPNAHLYDNRRSLYDAARECFPFAVLDEHFRSVEDIISFSNALCYDGRIKPLRDESGVQRVPAVVAHHVVDGRYDEGAKVNDPEARALAALLVACTEQREYDGATFGMISLLGDDQALRVDELVRRWLPESEYTRRRIVCGNAAHFQGDERDVMFLSLVRASPSSRQSSQQKPLMAQTKDEAKQRINVAASRARDQLWIVHSLVVDVDLKVEDFRHRLLRHAADPAAVRRASAEPARADSEFERRVAQHLVAAGFPQVVPRWKVGAFSLDLVVVGADGRVAIECDGDRIASPEQLQRDVDRQRILERLGWRFIRLRGSEFFADEPATMKRVIERLSRLGVVPGAAKTEAAKHDLRERVVKRAAALLIEDRS